MAPGIPVPWDRRVLPQPAGSGPAVSDGAMPGAGSGPNPKIWGLLRHWGNPSACYKCLLCLLPNTEWKNLLNAFFFFFEASIISCIFMSALLWCCTTIRFQAFQIYSKSIACFLLSYKLWPFLFLICLALTHQFSVVLVHFDHCLFFFFSFTHFYSALHLILT